MYDGSRKDQAKCIVDLLPSELKNVSYSWAFFYFLRLLNTIFTMQIIDSALVHWVKTLSVLISAEHFFVRNYFDLLFQRHSFLSCSLKLHTSIFFFKDIHFCCVLWSYAHFTIMHFSIFMCTAGMLPVQCFA